MNCSSTWWRMVQIGFSKNSSILLENFVGKVFFSFFFFENLMMKSWRWILLSFILWIVFVTFKSWKILEWNWNFWNFSFYFNEGRMKETPGVFGGFCRDSIIEGRRFLWYFLQFLNGDAWYIFFKFSRIGVYLVVTQTIEFLETLGLSQV